MPLHKKKKRLRKKGGGGKTITHKKNTKVPKGIVSNGSQRNSSCAAKIKLSKLTPRKLKTFSYDKGGVKSIYSPFNRRFAILSHTVDKSKKKMPQVKREHKSNGLTSKEKVYILTSCQTRSIRYKRLKDFAAEAVCSNKIFAVLDNNESARKALVERGWVEKIPLTRMNLSKIRNNTDLNKAEIQSELERLLLSHFVEKQPANFIWRSSPDTTMLSAYSQAANMPIVSKLRQDEMWTTKQGLCSSLKRNYWFYIEDIAEANSPRTYNSFGGGEIEGFTDDFRITACTSLLKWVLSMVANDRPVFVSSGNISMNVLLFALNRCKEYLFRKQHKDIDYALNSVSPGQWNSYLKKYYSIIAKIELFEPDTDNQLPLYLAYAKFLLTEIHKYRPQLSCEGCHNIWIIKPTHCCRGRGIRMASKLGVITEIFGKNTNSEYVVQKYIEEPLLIHDTKFDIRLYYLVTSTCPLVIWTYKDCYLKFSSQKYNLKNYHESIHLTNNAVQKRYKNCDNRHDELPVHNMWDSEKYKSYLTRIGKDDVWDAVIYPGMKKSVVAVMLSCQESMSFCKNRFELYGCDFILDKSFNPWLIEINSVPDLEPTTPVTAKICPAVVADVIKVVIDQRDDPNAPTGSFECAYRQPLTIPRFTMSLDLTLRGHSLPPEYFYKGKVEIQESYHDPSIGKERDIKGIMKKMKKIYEKDIMIVPDTGREASHKVKIVHKSKSETELSEVSTLIIEQLDELIDRVTLVSDPDPEKNVYDTVDKTEDGGFSHYDNIDNFLETSSNLLSNEVTDVKETFQFSALDDIESGNERSMSSNCLQECSSCKVDRSHSEELERDLNKINEIFNCSSDCDNDNVDTAIADLIYFIRQKETECGGNS